jgi:hypothetical protein
VWLGPERSTERAKITLSIKSGVHMIVCINTLVRFQNLTAVLLKIRVFWDVKPTHLSKDRRIFIFGVKQCKRSVCLTLKMKALRSFETSVAICLSTRHRFFKNKVLPKRSFLILTAVGQLFWRNCPWNARLRITAWNGQNPVVKGPCCIWQILPVTSRAV